jgi:hypothetical protein
MLSEQVYTGRGHVGGSRSRKSCCREDRRHDGHEHEKSAELDHPESMARLGHRDNETTQRYADYSPSAHESAFVEAAFGRVAPADRLAAQTT